MKRSRRSYDNIVRWKVERSAGRYAIVPAQDRVFWGLRVVLPGVALFYWLVHHGVEIDDPGAVVIADLILAVTVVVIAAFCLNAWRQVARDDRALLVVDLAAGEVRLPRAEKWFRLGDGGTGAGGYTSFES